MTVDALIKKLSAYPGDMEVTITDGYDCRCYQGEYSVEVFEGAVDIGVGGTEQVS